MAYETKEETSSQAIHIESIFPTCTVGARKGRNAITLHIPGGFVQADMDEIIHAQQKGKNTNSCQVDFEKRPFIRWAKFNGILA